MKHLYIIYGVKDDNKFYIMNTNPLIWTSIINKAKLYDKSYLAEYDVLREYDNYHAIKNQLAEKTLDEIYIALINFRYEEIGRAKLL